MRAPQREPLGGPTWVWGSVVSYPAGGQAEPRPPVIFSYIQIKSQLIFGHRCVSTRLQRWANRDKSGTPSQKQDKWAFRENCDFCRDMSLKIRDGWSPYAQKSYYDNFNFKMIYIVNLLPRINRWNCNDE